MNHDLSRRPLSETVKKHGRSGLFLAAAVISLAGVVLRLIYSIHTAFVPSEQNLSMTFFDEGILYYPEFFVSFFLSIALGVIQIIMCAQLINAYRYFSGNKAKSFSPEKYLTLTKVSLILDGIYVVFTLFTEYLASIDDTASYILLFGLFVAPIIGGTVVFIVFYYKAIRKTVNSAMAASADLYRGNVSVFLIVITIISTASLALGMLPTSITPVDPASVQDQISWYWLAETAIALTTVVSQFFYILIMFRFKNELELSRGEWEMIRRKTEYTEALERDARLKQASAETPESMKAETVTCVQTEADSVFDKDKDDSLYDEKTVFIDEDTQLQSFLDDFKFN